LLNAIYDVPLRNDSLKIRFAVRGMNFFVSLYCCLQVPLIPWKATFF